MTTTRNRTVRYAEDTLGVNDVFSTAVEIESNLRKTLADRAGLEQAINGIKAGIEIRTADIRSDVLGEYGTLSATAYESKVKDVCGQDGKLRKMREDLLAKTNRLADLDAEIRIEELEHRSRVARLHELGGYFQYLASSKNAFTAARTSVNDFPF